VPTRSGHTLVENPLSNEQDDLARKFSDLNPIENIWKLLKHNIDKRFSHTNSEVRRCVEEEWARLQSADFLKYIGNMKERCQAVINAQGEHTKW
jgi:hypothetical protein